MSCSLTCSSAEGYFRICVDGTWRSTKSHEIITDIFNLWAKQPGQPLLLDILSMENTPSTSGDYMDAQLFSDAGFGRIGRIAVLDNLDRRGANDFFEMTARNRGLRFRFFYASEQDAIKWLLHEGQDQA